MQPLAGGTHAHCQQADSFEMLSSGMKIGMTHLIAALLGGIVVLPPVHAAASEDIFDQDHDLARDLYVRGEIHALSEILPVVQARSPGRIIAVELDRRDDRWVYRFQVIDAAGHRRIVDVDASIAVVIEDEEKTDENPRR